MKEQEEYYNDLLTNFGELTVALMTLPILLGVIRIRSMDKLTTIFFLYLTFTFAINILEIYFIWSVNNYTDFWLPFLKKWEIGDTHFLRILSQLKSFLLLGWYFDTVVKHEYPKNSIFVFTLFLSLFSLVDYIWITGYKMPGSAIPLINGLFVTILPMLHLWYLTRKDYRLPLTKISHFWFSLGIIMANLFTLIFYFFGQKLYETNFALFVQISILRNCLMILSQFLYVKGFFQIKYIKYLGKND